MRKTFINYLGFLLVVLSLATAQADPNDYGPIKQVSVPVGHPQGQRP